MYSRVLRVPRVLKRTLARFAVRAGEASLEALGVPPPGAILILGHMRSGSTLLLHLLMTTPEIAAMGERNAVYASEGDLARLVMTTRLARRLPLAKLRYVADQINHSRFTPSRALLGHARVRLIFLIRRPEASIVSLIKLTGTHYEAWSVERAVDYYVERLEAIARHADAVSDTAHAVFLPYEDLTDHPRESLAGLQTFLGTRLAFSEHYALHDFTGKRGDPGPNISTGWIARPSPLTEGQLPAGELSRATRAYEGCRDRLSRLALGRSA